jgi:hypothetical protein
MKKMLICLFIGGFAFAAQAADGVGTTSTSASAVRGEKKIGTYLAIGNPFPSIIGINAAYHVTPRIRATIGYGEIEVTTSVSISGTGVSSEKLKAKTYGVGADYMIMEGNFTPIVGLHGGYFDVSGKGSFSVQGLDKSTGLAYTNAGIDWVADNGFNFGTGVNVALLGSSGVSFYGNLGYFF